jgi:parvulin-like peptidyl-prolyl isomerase
LLLLVGLLPALAGCGDGGRGSGAATIARVAGRDVLLREFEPVLGGALVGSSGSLTDEVKSRLLDQFLETRVLLEEAQRRGIEVSDAELERALRWERTGADDLEHRGRVLNSLLVEKLLRVIVAESVEISPEDEERYFREHPDEFHRPAVMVVRQILLEDPGEAEATRRELEAAPEGFEEAARQRSRSPDRGHPRSYAVEELPRQAEGVLRTLKPREISPVVEMPPYYVIFRLDEVREERSIPLQEARPRIRARLQEERGAGALSRVLAELKTRMDVELFQENLPFRYVQEDPA